MSDESEQLRETEAYFHEKIPLTRAMGVRVESYDGRKLVLTAPLARSITITSARPSAAA